jgi:hypothetical protein
VDDVVFNDRGDVLYVAANYPRGAVVTYDREGRELDRVETKGVAVSLSRSLTGGLAVLTGSRSLALIDPQVQ